jgi:integrase
LIADVLLVYLREHAVHTHTLKAITQTVSNLEPFWGDKKLTDVTAKNCRAYAAARPKVAARRDLQTLRAAINYWHREYGPLPSVPIVVLPDAPAARERWLTRSEVARLVWAARRTQHLRRLILIGIYTGTRPGAILSLQWDQIDLVRGVMHRLREGESETKKRRPPVRRGRKILFHLRRWRRIDNGNSVYVCHYNGQRVTQLRMSWPRAVKRAGLSGRVTPHTLRHSRTVHLMMAGVPIWEAAGQLGMSPTVLETVYSHWHPDFGKRAAQV